MALDVLHADLGGTLADCRPLSLLLFLASTKKSGVLTVRGRRSRVIVTLHEGIAVDADGEGHDDVLAAIVEALRTPSGEFAFEQRDLPPPPLVAPDMVTLLQRAIAELQAWEALSDVVPSTSLVVTLQQTAETEVSLSSSAWTLSVAVAGGHTTPAAAAAHLGWTLLRTCPAVKELVDAGRARLEPPPKRTRGSSGRRVDGASEKVTSKKRETKALWPGAGVPTHDRFRIGYYEE
jgi:hypothetical protein